MARGIPRQIKEMLMKRNRAVFYVMLIVLALFYSLTCGFAAASVKAPQTFYTTVEVGMSDGGKVSPSSASNVTLDVEKGTNKVYAYIGEVYSFKTDENGKPYVNVIFDFKRRASSDTSYSKKVGDGEDERIYLVNGSGGYRWTLIYDGKDTEFDYDRVKIYTYDAMDICEVAFVNKDGKVLSAEYKYGSSIDGETGHENICDEENSFTSSLSGANVFTDKETEEIAAVKTVMRNGGKTLGKGVFGAEINALSVAVFGLNTFALRFPSVLAGFAIIVGVYLLVDYLFGNSYIAAFSAVICLTAENVFSASIMASGAVAACFALYSFYFAIKFFVEDYYVESKSNATKNIGLCGMFFGLSAAADTSLITLFIGLAFIVAYAAVRGSKKFRAEEKAAEGLGKEDVYVAYRSKKAFFRISSACSLLVLPAVILLISYAFVGNALKEIYGGGFLSAAFGEIGSSFGFGENIIPVNLLAGFGSENLGGGRYAFANYITSCLCAVSLVFVAVLIIIKNKNDKIGRACEGCANRTKLILTAFVSAFITLTFGKGTYASDFALCSAFYAAVAALGLSLALKLFGEKAKVVAVVCLCVCISAFAMNYVGLTGINVSETARKVFYAWQI